MRLLSESPDEPDLLDALEAKTQEPSGKLPSAAGSTRRCRRSNPRRRLTTALARCQESCRQGSRRSRRTERGAGELELSGRVSKRDIRGLCGHELARADRRLYLGLGFVIKCPFIVAVVAELVWLITFLARGSA
jgi:hypothetical protein